MSQQQWPVGISGVNAGVGGGGANSNGKSGASSHPNHAPGDWSREDSALEQRMASMHLQQQQHPSMQPSPAKNYSAFGGGLFFQEAAKSGSGVGSGGLFGSQPSSSFAPERSMFEQQQQRGPMGMQQQQQQYPSFAQQQPMREQQYPSFSQQPSQQHQGPPQAGGKSILNEVMSMMQHPQQQQQQPPHSHVGPPSFPGPSFAPSSSSASSLVAGPGGLRPPIGMRGTLGGGGGGGGPPPGLSGPPGFKAGPPPGFQNGPPPGMQGPPPQQSPQAFLAPTLPAPLQNDSHVQCSLCQVIVVNNPQALFMHDHSVQHLENERRQAMQRQMQQQQPHRGMPGAGLDPSLDAFSSPTSSPPSGPAASPAGPPSFDLASLQAQLRSFMLASEQAKQNGTQPPPMDWGLMNQLKQVQDAMQGQKNGQQQPQQQQQQAGSTDEQKGGAASSGIQSSAGPFPTREALIAASSQVHFLSLKRLNFKRGPSFLEPLNLGFDLRALLDTLRPEPQTFQEREEIRAGCEKLVQQAWGKEKCEVKLFGSSVNTLAETTSDVDLCLSIRDMDSLSLDKPMIVEKIALLFKPYFKDILALPKARVPIVKFVSGKTGLHCDIGINNHLACKNSELIRDYMRLDPRAREMCLLVKHWAKMRKINDPYRGTLSSYCYVMMVIHYLQNAMHCNPPILPCLQSYRREEATKEELEASIIDGFDCWYFTDIAQLETFGDANKQTLGELLIGFFRLYSHEFDFKDTVVSIRTSGYLDKKKKVWAASGKKDRHLFCVEDPFDVTHNLSRGCDATALYEIRGEFMRAFRMLVQESASIYDVLRQYTKEWRADRGK